MRRPTFPDELELVLFLAGCQTRRAELRSATLALLERADFRLLRSELADRRLLPLIGSRVVNVGGELVPEWFQAAVTRARTTARAHGLAIEARTREITSALGEAGIAALPLKGPLLAEAAHSDLGLRETGDVDLLIDPKELDDAVRILRTAGYDGPPEVRRWNGLPDLHFGLRHPTRPRVELHWRVYWYERNFSADLLARAKPGKDRVLRADAKDLAASLLLFYARDGFHGIRLAADLAAWWDRNRDVLPAAFLEDHVRRYPALVPALTAAAHAAERITGVPASGWLGTRVASGRRVAVATRLADWTQHGDRDQLRANISLVGGLLGPPGSVREFARRELMYKEPGGGVSTAHGIKTCLRFGLAFWNVRGTRSWATSVRT